MSVNWEDSSSFPLAVFLSIVGAAGGLCMAYAVAYLMGATASNDPNRFEVPIEQKRYMREVRARNIRDMRHAAGRRRAVEARDDELGLRGRSLRR